MPNQKTEEIAKSILHWLTDRGVDVTKFTAKKGGKATKWGITNLSKLVIFGIKETSKLGGNALKDFKDFVGPKLPKVLKKLLRVKPEELNEDDVVTEDKKDE